jgi:hypothetical protein
MRFRAITCAAFGAEGSCDRLITTAHGPGSRPPTSKSRKPGAPSLALLGRPANRSRASNGCGSRLLVRPTLSNGVSQLASAGADRPRGRRNACVIHEVAHGLRRGLPGSLPGVVVGAVEQLGVICGPGPRTKLPRAHPVGSLTSASSPKPCGRSATNRSCCGWHGCQDPRHGTRAPPAPARPRSVAGPPASRSRSRAMSVPGSGERAAADL